MDNHEHRYFIFEVKAAFEPYTTDTTVTDMAGVKLYERVEYAIMGCNCGAVTKRRVKETEND